MGVSALETLDLKEHLKGTYSKYTIGSGAACILLQIDLEELKKAVNEGLILTVVGGNPKRKTKYLSLQSVISYGLQYLCLSFDEIKQRYEKYELTVFHRSQRFKLGRKKWL